jgi:hypothetical protein
LTGQKVYFFIVLNVSFRWKKRSRRDRRLGEENAGDEKSEQNLETGEKSQTETEDQRTASAKIKDHIVEVREVRGGTCTRLAGSADQLL